MTIKIGEGDENFARVDIGSGFDQKGFKDNLQMSIEFLEKQLQGGVTTIETTQEVYDQRLRFLERDLEKKGIIIRIVESLD